MIYFCDYCEKEWDERDMPLQYGYYGDIMCPECHSRIKICKGCHEDFTEANGEIEFGFCEVCASDIQTRYIELIRTILDSHFTPDELAYLQSAAEDDTFNLLSPFIGATGKLQEARTAS